MNIGNLDTLDEHGVLTGWFITSGSANAIEFAVTVDNNVVAMGRRTVTRPDVLHHYGINGALARNKVGFRVRISPTIKLGGESEMKLIDLSSMSVIPTNKFLPSAEYLGSYCNSDKTIAQNVAHIKDLVGGELIDEFYTASLDLTDHPPSSVARFYTSMVDYWNVSPCSWVDAELIRGQQNLDNTLNISPLEYLLSCNRLDLLPNAIFHPEYVASLFPRYLDGVAENSPASILKAWLKLLADGVLLRPSPIVRTGFGNDGVIKRANKNFRSIADVLREIARGNGTFRGVAGIAPVFSDHWLETRPLKANMNGTSVLRRLLLGDGSVPPNPYFNSHCFKHYMDLCWESDSGISQRLGVIAHCLHDDLLQSGLKESPYNPDKPLLQLSGIHFKPGTIDWEFIEGLLPGVFDYIAAKTKLRDKFEIYRCYLEQLGIPRSFNAIEFPLSGGTFNLSLLRRLGMSGEREPKATIIIPTLGRIDLLFNALRSMSLCHVSVPIEVILADDCSVMDLSVLHYFFPSVRVVRTERNKGFLGNVNNAANHAKGQFLIVANNDILVHANAIDELIEAIDSRPLCDVMGGMVLSANGEVQEIGGAVWNDGSAWNLFRGWNSNDESLPRNIREADYISGCWMAIRKTAWEAHAGFSEEFAPAYCEDLDFCLKVWKSGRQVMVNPGSTVTHFEGASMGRDTGSVSELKRFQVINQERILKKWMGYLASRFNANGNPSIQYRGYKTNKPIAVIFDHCCPEPDRDAGSKSILDLIRAIAGAEKYYCIFVPANGNYSKYARQLERLGVEVICGSAGWERFDQLLANHNESIELVLCSRLHVAERFNWHIAKCGGTKVIYIHDVEEIRQATGLGISEKYAAAGYRKHLERWGSQYKNFDYVLTCSEEEQRALERYLTIPVTSFPVFRVDELGVGDIKQGHSELEMIFVGSLNHPPNLTGIEWFVSDVFPQLKKHLPTAKLHLVGSGFENCKFLDRAGVVLHGQVSEATLGYLYSLCATSIAPLLEGAGMKGKVVEALSKGIPCIGTDIAYQGMERCLSLLPPPLSEISSGPSETLAQRIIKFAKQSRPPLKAEIFAALKGSFGSRAPGEVLLNILHNG